MLLRIGRNIDAARRSWCIGRFAGPAKRWRPRGALVAIGARLCVPVADSAGQQAGFWNAVDLVLVMHLNGLSEGRDLESCHPAVAKAHESYRLGRLTVDPLLIDRTAFVAAIDVLTVLG